MDTTQMKTGNSAEFQQNKYDPYSDPEALFNTEECARMRGCSVSTIRRERRERIGIPFIRINCNTVRYRRRDILNHIGSLRRIETSNPGRDCTPDHVVGD